jgi:MATE family multidrug resistance protein
MCVYLLRCFEITLMPLAIYCALLWGMGLGGGYVWAYLGIGEWAATPQPGTFWIASAAALGLVMLLFLALTYRAARKMTL